jgi:hypothetical protein
LDLECSKEADRTRLNSHFSVVSGASLRSSQLQSVMLVTLGGKGDSLVCEYSFATMLDSIRDRGFWMKMARVGFVEFAMDRSTGTDSSRAGGQNGLIGCSTRDLHRMYHAYRYLTMVNLLASSSLISLYWGFDYKLEAASVIPLIA